MRRHSLASAVIVSFVIAALPALLPAQRASSSVSRGPAAGNAEDLSAAKPGRNPDQPIDSAYTAKIHEYTTEPFFLSPLVDYLPAGGNVPTPSAVLGDIAGAPTKLPYSSEVYEYMRLLEKASPRVKVFSIGTTEEGREMIAVAVASEALIAGLDANREKLAKLADPRSIGMNDSLAAAIAADAAPVYYITGTIHSPEAGAPTALMEMAYRLAVDESDYIRNIRNNLITLITPVVEVDGRDRMVDVYNWRVKHPGETYPNLVYWGKYVAHDNNRDAMGMTLKLTQNVLDTYVGFKAQVLHDLHESVPYLYDNTIGDGPYNAWLDPLLTNEWQMIGWNNVQEMTRMGMPGVFAHGTFDTWSPGYLMFIAATHNGISRLYETFGNGGTAETVERTLSPDETSRTWYRQNPPLPRVQWSLRNNNNYEQTGVLVSLSYFANNRRLFLENFYQKSKRSVLKPGVEGPAAYVLPADDRRLGAQAALLTILQKQAVEISRATAPFTVALPAAHAANTSDRGADSSSRGRADSTRAKADSTKATTRTFPAGSYVIRMDQPYSRIADALLDYQYWSPDDPQKNPYDDTGWTFPEGFNTQAIRVTDVKVLDVPMQTVTGTIRAPGGVEGDGAVFVIEHNADNALATLRYRLAKADFQSAEESFEAAGRKFPRGSFIVRGVSRADLDTAGRELGVRAFAVSAAPTVKMHPARAARVALMHTWMSTQTEGWWRFALDNLAIPYDYISTQDIAAIPDLNAKYDVILFPPAGGSGVAIIEGMPMWRNPIPWKKTDLTPNLGRNDSTDDMRPGLGWNGLQKLKAFVEKGGVLVGVSNTAEFAVDFGLTSGVSVNAARRGSVVGSLLRSKLVDETSPIVYGVADDLAVYSEDGASFSISNRNGGRGGFGGGGGDGRPTGRGTADDPDVTQGFANDTAFSAPPRPSVKPWQAAPITDEQMRNPLGIIPPDQRPRVPLRFADSKNLLVSGLLSGGGDIAQRPVVVDVPVRDGHVVLFASNPIWRGSTTGSYFLVFNTILNWDNLDAGRVLDKR
ncbi:MAG TPA: M14 family zinc carboxypeptidase [Gemmatimonadaceae bacterium]|nr:M14 family zinc carboxypeptidase [Gemmatimonadaceae bacterium]